MTYLPFSRRASLRVVFVLAAAIASAFSAPVAAQSTSADEQSEQSERTESPTTNGSGLPVDPNADLAAERARIEARQADLRIAIDVASAENAAVLTELARLDAIIVEQRAALATAETASAEAVAARKAARTDEADAIETLETAHAVLRRLAADAYITGPDTPVVVLLGGDVEDSGKRRVLAETRLDQLTEAVDDLRRARERAEEVRANADEAEAEALRAHTEVVAMLADLDAARSAQAGLADEVADRVDEALREEGDLSVLDQELIGELQRREADAEQRTAERLAQAAQARRDAAAAAAAEAATYRPSTPGVIIDAVTDLADVQTAWVRGIEVNVALAPSLEAMMAAAEADGIALTGSGYRTIERQIQIRAAVCGPTEYDIWVKPSWECSPPVARPGYSNHQLGLAVDFTLSGGDLVRDGGHDIVQWLHANANAYGFYNLASEPWHWSVNGR